MADSRTHRAIRIRWIAVAYYLGSGALFVWLLGSVVVHLFGGRGLASNRGEGGGRSLGPMQVYRCWASVDKAFASLLQDFGREVARMARGPRDLKRTWGARYGWDLVPLAQFPESRLTREDLGPWRWRLLRIQRSCALTDSEALEKSKVLADLAQVVPQLDALRVALTRRMRSFVDSGEAIPSGGEAALIGSIRDTLKDAKRRVERMFHGRLPTAPRLSP